MEPVTLLTAFFYIVSTASYLAYLFTQKDRHQSAGFWLLAAGFACHTGNLALQSIQAGHLPVQNMHGNLSIAAWAVAGVFLLFRVKFGLKILGLYAAPLAAMIMLTAAKAPVTTDPQAAGGLFSSFWLVLHVVVIFLGEAAFALACGTGILYLLQENAIKSKGRRFFFKRLPSLELLDNTGYHCIIVGFTLLTFGLITGLVYAKTVWGRFWSWDPKEVWSAVSWLLYAALLHGRLTSGWRGRRAALMAIFGFIVLLFTFFGVNILFQGHHGEFTKW